jgi:acyl-CoA thioesterase YciA
MSSAKQLLLKVIPRPLDENPRGDIFGGWLMSQIDLAGMILGVKEVTKQFATVAAEFSFKKPIFTFDEVAIFGEIVHRGNTSFTVEFSLEVARSASQYQETVSAGSAKIVYAAIKAPGEKSS